METIDNLTDLLNKAKNFAKNYKGSKTEAARAKAYEENIKKAQNALLKSPEVPESLKTVLAASQANAQAAWDFYKTGQPCSVSGKRGGGEAFFKLPLADCAAFVEAIESEVKALEAAKGSFTCNCTPLISDCSSILTVLDQIRQANIDKKTKVLISKGENKSRLSNDTDRVTALNGIDIEGKCFKIGLEFKFNGDKNELNPKKYTETKDGFDLMDDNGKTILSIQILGELGQAKYLKQAILKKYLLLEQKKNIDSTKSNLKLVYVNSDDKKVITDEIEELLLKILKNADIDRTIRITSTKRSPEEQVKAMITNIISKGAEAQKRLYGAKGDVLIDYYVEIKDKNSESEIISLMVEKKINIEFISAHEDWVNKGAIDLGKNSNDFGGKYSKEVQPIIDSAKNEEGVNSSQVFPPRDGENALHIEFKLN